MSKKSIVALVKENDVQANVTKVFDLLGGVSNLIEEGSKVVLKPNAGHAAPPESAVDTNPEFVRAVIREIKKAKPSKIIIAEAAALGCDTLTCFEVSGIAEVAREEGVELIDIKREKDLINVPVRGYKSNISHVLLPRFIVEAEHIVNLPVLKTHASMLFSGALKNIKGVVQDAVHLLMHRQNLAMAMMDVWYAVRADINIMDVTYAAGGYSPHTPTPLYYGCALGSLDPVAVDRVACEIAGIDADSVDYFKVAEEAGFGNGSLDDIEIVGESVDTCKKNLWVPYLGGMNKWPEYNLLSKGACSSCQAVTALNMETLKAIGEYEKNSHKTIVIGGGNADDIPKDIEGENLILHGNCTKRYLKDHPDALWIRGCPPAEPAMYYTVVYGKAFSDDPALAAEIRPKLDANGPVWKAYVEERAKEFYASQKEKGEKSDVK